MQRLSARQCDCEIWHSQNLCISSKFTSRLHLGRISRYLNRLQLVYRSVCLPMQFFTFLWVDFSCNYFLQKLGKGPLPSSNVIFHSSNYSNIISQHNWIWRITPFFSVGHCGSSYLSAKTRHRRTSCGNTKVRWWVFIPDPNALRSMQSLEHWVQGEE